MPFGLCPNFIDCTKPLANHPQSIKAISSKQKSKETSCNIELHDKELGIMDESYLF